MKEDKVGSDGNNKVQNPGEMLQGKSAPRSQSEEEEDQEELVVGRAKRKVSQTKTQKQESGDIDTKKQRGIVIVALDKTTL